MKIVILGAGNAATVLGKLLNKGGVEVVQVFSRNINAAKTLAQSLSARACNRYEEIDADAELHLVALADRELPHLQEHLPTTVQAIAHTAGSVAMNVLANMSPNHGVFYPLQSLRKEMEMLTSIPLLVDGSNEYTVRLLTEMGKRISSSVERANDDQRLKLHLAAVMVNNFTNHLYAEAERFCIQQRVDFSLLLPLIEETAKRVTHISPSKVMTGPATRGDEATIHRHLELLEGQPRLRSLYKQLTDSIQQSS